MLKIELQKKRVTRPEGGMALRVNHIKHGTKSKKSAPCYRIRCGCCNEVLDIFYFDPEDESFGLELNGVNGSLENWREILLPILRIEQKNGELIDISQKAVRARQQLEQMREKYL